MLASVLVEYNLSVHDKFFDYIIPNNLTGKLKIGHKVIVPFGKQKVEGFVLKIHNNKENIEYKEIEKITNEEFIINTELLNLGKFISEKTVSPLITCYQAMFPKALKASAKTNINKKYIKVIKLNNELVDAYTKEKNITKQQLEIINLLKEKKELKKSEITSSSLNTLIKNNIVLVEEKEINRTVYYTKETKKNITLNKEQQRAYNTILNSENKNILLYGVTGSGKTEIYIKLIKEIIKQGKTAIYLVPEISLTPQIITRLNSEFEKDIAILHSRLSEGEKYDEYRKIMKKEVHVVVGARSAIFSPLENIGAIIIDESSSSAYKQESTPKYNAVDIALKRASTHNAYVILGSATPLLEQYARGEKDIFKLIELKTRVNKTLPKIEIINMEAEAKKRNLILSGHLREKINERLQKKEQVILLLNRRGFSTYISCSSCGYVHKCPNCDITLIYHKTTKNLRCHYCSYTKYMTNTCPSCNSENLLTLGLGTEKLEEYIKNEFKEAKVLRIDTDTTSNKGSHDKLIQSFKAREYDILVGTQMISKGLNFPYVTLVGVINADNSLNIPDFRSHERTFEILMQTSGRSGRAELPGEVIIQTYNPDNYVLECVKKQDYLEFYKKEMNVRKILKYPPYFYLVQIKISSKEYEKAKQESIKAKQYLENNLGENFIILGPSTSNIFKLKNKYYFSIIIKYKKEENLFKVLKELKANGKEMIDININPLSTI